MKISVLKELKVRHWKQDSWR